MVDIRDRFIDYVCSLISDDYLRSTLRDHLESVPAPFWSAPASSSGKYHPSYALGTGGLVRHTLVCLWVARDLARAYDITTKFDLDVITIAATFHDTYKGGYEAPWTETLIEHPVVAAASLGDDVPWIARNAIEGHMSLWSPDPFKKALYNMDRYTMLVSHADYIASRKYLEPSAELYSLLEEFYPEEEV